MDPNSTDTTMNAPTIFSGLSGNEMYCVNLLGYSPGNLIVGNSVFSMGIIGDIGSNVRTSLGGEISQITNMISEGRSLSLTRFTQELTESNGSGAAGVTSELIMHPGNIEFLTVGSCVHREDGMGSGAFTTSADGQELFCQWDAGYQPISFVFGNIAYSIGLARGFLGSIREIAKGEVKQYSDIFNQTRNAALSRLEDEARKVNANSVVGVRTTILPVGENNLIQEMVMIGTASYNEQIAELATSVGGVTTSDMTAEETWNIAQLGYTPLKLVIGTSVYSLGFVGSIKAALKNMVKGEISDLTQLIYGAREESLKRVQEQAQAIGADHVMGIKTYIYNLTGDLIEFLAIGTAVKKVSGIGTRSQQLPAQAIIRDKDTFIDTANSAYGSDLQAANKSRSGQLNTEPDQNHQA